MSIIADLHIHSKYSRAVSQKMDLNEISLWASKKAINLVTTGDWTHPLWFREIKTNLKETSPGIFTLVKKPAEQTNEVYFMLTTEISSIYNQDGQTRRIHNLIFSPSIQTAEKIIKELQNRGANLLADGRPIIGLSAKELLELILTVDKNAFLIPCHAWTPWFSLYGSKSGFDSIEECFGDLGKYIYAVESGLSSDPIMNWQIKELANRSIVSFSDAHSGPKLGREATVFVPKIPNDNPPAGGQIPNLTYIDIVDAIKQKPDAKLKIGYTIEFFPQEGKYHWTGHRACNIRYSPKESKKNGLICPVCHRSLTVGVEERVAKLSEKIINEEELVFLKNSQQLTFVYDKEKKRTPFVSLVPLIEVLLEILNNSPTKAAGEYERLIPLLGGEFDILLNKSYPEIENAGGQKLREAIQIVRERKVSVDPGYDGVFGTVKIFQKNDEKNEQKKDTQQTLF